MPRNQSFWYTQEQLKEVLAELNALKEEFAEFKEFVEFELKQARLHSLTEEIHKVVVVRGVERGYP